jgi:hypothetical protein
MKRVHGLHAGLVFTALLVSAMAWFLVHVFVRSPSATAGLEDNNPQKFHLWTTGSNFSYTFTCDPHASDIWMFRTAGGTRLLLPTQPDNLPLSTNPWTGREKIRY